jgi:hypothetical protein
MAIGIASSSSTPAPHLSKKLSCFGECSVSVAAAAASVSGHVYAQCCRRAQYLGTTAVAFLVPEAWRSWRSCRAREQVAEGRRGERDEGEGGDDGVVCRRRGVSQGVSPAVGQGQARAHEGQGGDGRRLTLNKL